MRADVDADDSTLNCRKVVYVALEQMMTDIGTERRKTTLWHQFDDCVVVQIRPFPHGPALCTAHVVVVTFKLSQRYSCPELRQLS